MLNRSVRIALTIGLTLGVVPVAASAATSEPPAGDVGAHQPATVTLPTGHLVRLTGKPGHEQVHVEPSTPGKPVGSFVTRRVGSKIYVVPEVAEPFLGTVLDPGLFDVTNLAAAAEDNGRLPVRISYRGRTPVTPGITITSASNGTANGYLTPSSTAAFGQALTTLWKADRKTGTRQSSSLFTGVRKISTVMAPSTTRTAVAAPTFPFVVKVIGPDGEPQDSSRLGIFNVDEGTRFQDYLTVRDGEARADVPKGTYSLISEDWAYDPATRIDTLRVTTVTELKITGAGQTVTLDHRTATVEPAVTVPKPTDLSTATFEWTRLDAAGRTALRNGYRLDANKRLLLAPAKPATVGTVRVRQLWTLTQPVATPTYSYTVGVDDKQMPTKARYTFNAADLATVNDSFYAEGPARTTAFLRYPSSSSISPDYALVPRGTRRTAYLGFIGAKPKWHELMIVNYYASEARNYLDSPERLIPAGTTTSVNWLKGPLGAAIPQLPAGQDSMPTRCFGCRSGKRLSINLVPFTDSSLSHTSSIFPIWGATPVSRFRFYKNGKLLSDQDNVFGDTFSAAAGKATYRVVLDVDHRLLNPAQSTRTKTELTFSSAQNAGKRLAKGWDCDGGRAKDCRALPVVQARLALPLSLNGTLPAGKSKVVVTVGQVQNATKSSIKSAGLQIRPAGRAWLTVKLKAIGGGKYQGTIDNTKLTGASVDVRFSGADKAGSKYQQTILRAYTVAAAQ